MTPEQINQPELTHDVCSCCGNEIDPEVCWCGEYMKDQHYSSGHNQVPMGCDCGRHQQPEKGNDQ